MSFLKGFSKKPPPTPHWVKLVTIGDRHTL